MCYFGLICSPIYERAASKAPARDKISSGARVCGGRGRGFLINLDMVMSMRAVGPGASLIKCIGPQLLSAGSKRQTLHSP